MKLKIFFILAVYCLLFSAHAVKAQDFYVGVAPARQQLTAKPGEKKRIALIFVNRSLYSVDGRVGAVDFIVKGDNNEPYFLNQADLNNRYSAASWIQLPFTQATIAAQDKVIIYADINVPANATPGGHYAAIYFEGSPLAGQSNTGRNGAAQIAPRTNGLIYIRVAGPVTVKSAVEEFVTNKLWENGPVTINTEISNAGDIHVTPAGKITITNMLGGITDSSVLETKNIFPGTLSKYQNSLGRKWMFGRYTLTLTANDGVTTNPLTASVSIWVIPWKLLTIIILSIIILLLLFKNIYRRLIQREQSMQSEISNERKEIQKLKEQLRRRDE